MYIYIYIYIYVHQSVTFEHNLTFPKRMCAARPSPHLHPALAPLVVRGQPLRIKVPRQLARPVDELYLRRSRLAQQALDEADEPGEVAGQVDDEDGGGVARVDRVDHRHEAAHLRVRDRHEVEAALDVHL